ncbi:hypothetical protein Hoch_6246 [Haliangium ochraceum DSM 14365]|uniref:Prolyl 4-hydroxylase alpha subunit Fe(2+) 2OG dioxygenase domain-containing protein n=1 Tax=Haliangium ochraceum (strain DSM 14365 / JCM 11303 / SMP-2) TaxID=502025 RepID=D0LMN1_HALO1|nr:hypothetical protein Hoch_6246 [Haliangium ochraceum DSM 14365]
MDADGSGDRGRAPQGADAARHPLVDRFALFSTPVFVIEVPGTEALNRELAARLLAESQSSPGIQRSNVGGWHSVPDLGQRSEPCFRGFFGMLVDQLQQVFQAVAAGEGVRPQVAYRYGVQSWAMVMREGDYTITHDHATSHWSTAYYVDAGDADSEAHPDSGLLAFIDPRRATADIPGIDLFPSTFTVRPRTGALVVFPGPLQHYVHPYRGQRPRICISSNLRMEPAPPG